MTIFAVPEEYSSAHGDLIYTVYDAHSTDSATYPNYKYIADVYINSELIARIRKIQDPTTGIGIFNIGQLVRSYLSTSFNPSPSVLVAQTLSSGEFYITVVVKFGEEYDFVSYLDIEETSAHIYFNNYNARLVGQTSSLTAKADKFTTNNALRGKVLSTSSFYFVPYFPTTTGLITVTVTPSGGGSGFTTTFTPANAYDLKVLNISPVALNAIHAGTITAATTSYTVQVKDQTYTIEIICEPVYETYMLHFLNQYGGFESKLFSKVSRKTYKFEKKDFGKLPYTVDSSGNVNYKNANGVYNETKSVYANQIEERLTLNSDFITDAEYRWLADLVFSPIVYIEDGAYFFPVNITETNYEPKKAVNDELTNLTINIEYGQTLNTQFR